MEFTYDAYGKMIALLLDYGYTITDYHHCAEIKNPVILRHDIDFSLDKAVRFSELEAGIGVTSTYFALLSSDFYNPASAANREKLYAIAGNGSEIGLHFDEAQYRRQLGPLLERGDVNAYLEQLLRLIKKEARLLSELLELPIKTVSMHRPSPQLLELDLKIPGLINSYGKAFFKDFKYLSDSRRHWREDVLTNIESRQYQKIHILTHAFWYEDRESTLQESVTAFIHSGNQARYTLMAENIRDMQSILRENEV